MDEVNKDFFNQKNKFIINVSDKLLLYFSASGSRCFTCNDVTIIPFENSTVLISFTTSDNKELFNIQTNEEVKIYQKPYEKEYPCFVLNVNDDTFIQPNVCSGTIKIEGKCVVIQNPAYFSDC